MRSHAAIPSTKKLLAPSKTRLELNWVDLETVATINATIYLLMKTRNAFYVVAVVTFLFLFFPWL